MNPEQQLTLLESFYQIHDRFMANYPVVCKKGCAHCCTGDVTLTTLEAVYLLTQRPFKEQAWLLTALADHQTQEHFRPRYTTNQAANSALKNQPLPKEAEAQRGGPCALLTESQCPIYDRRPLGCRCLLSTVDCGETGEAEMDPLVLTVNLVMMQFIEHLDQRGCSGNLTDVVTTMADPARYRKWQAGQTVCRGLKLIANHPLQVLMVPPEHQSALGPLVREMQTLFKGADRRG